MTTAPQATPPVSEEIKLEGTLAITGEGRMTDLTRPHATTMDQTRFTESVVRGIVAIDHRNRVGLHLCPVRDIIRRRGASVDIRHRLPRYHRLYMVQSLRPH